MRRCPGLLIAVLPLVLVAAAQAPQRPSSAPSRSGVVVLYPADGSVCTGGTVRVIAVAPAERKNPGVTLDGRPLKMERAAFDGDWMPRTIRRPPLGNRPVLLDNRSEAALWVAVTSLAPGRHVLGADGAKVRLFRAARADGRGAPAGWPLFRPHLSDRDRAGSPACVSCHEESRSSGNWTLGAAKTPGACHACHAEADLQVRHGHVMDILSRCWTCHDPHGSTRPKLLTDEKKKLCTRCHEEGHSKG